jgi:hypothetical protein
MAKSKGSKKTVAESNVPEVESQTSETPGWTGNGDYPNPEGETVTNETTETLTTADIGTLDVGAVMGETPAEAPKVSSGPVTLSQKNVHRTGYVVYGVDGMRGSVFFSKSMFVGEPPASVTIADVPNLVYIDAALAEKKAAQRAKRAERKATAETRIAERKAKAEARLAKAQASLEKVKAAEQKKAAKEAAKTAQPVAGDAPTDGDTVTIAEQPFASETVSQ